MLTDDQIESIAADLWHAEQTGAWTTPPSMRHPDATVDDAYRIAMRVRDLKLAAGRRVAGHKIGLTSKAMREGLSAVEPDYGFIYDDWFVPEGATLERARMNRPLVEAEVVFVMKSELGGPNVHAADVIRATDFVLPALEIVDNRYSERGNNALVDSIADTAWCGGVVLGGNPLDLRDIDVRRLSATLSINGEIEQTGSARAVLANPINAVAWLARALYRFGTTMQPGDVILSGSFIRAMPIDAGDTITALYDEFGEVTVSLV